MTKLFLIYFALSLLLVGCSLPGYDLRYVIDQCGGADKIHQINTFTETAICTNGSIVWLKKSQ